MAAFSKFGSVGSGLQQRGAATALGLALALLSDRLKRSPFTAGSGPIRRPSSPLDPAETLATPKARSILSASQWLGCSGVAGVSLPRTGARYGSRRADLRRHGRARLGTERADPRHYSPAIPGAVPISSSCRFLLVAGSSRRNIGSMISVAAVVVFAALSPLSSSMTIAIRRISGRSTRRQPSETDQALADLEIKSLQGGAPLHILATGQLSFTIFHIPSALHAIYPKFSKAKLDLVYYVKPVKESKDGVAFIPAESAQPAQYDAFGRSIATEH